MNAPRCPKCGRYLHGDPAWPKALGRPPVEWCWFHGGVVGRWLRVLRRVLPPAPRGIR